MSLLDMVIFPVYICCLAGAIIVCGIISLFSGVEQ
jgi:Na+/glutamate symporter